MSLEDKIGELTAAVNALTAALAHPFPALKGAKPWVSEVISALEQAKAFVPDVTHNPVQAKAEVAPPKSQPTPVQAAPTTAPSTSPAPETSVSTPTIDYAEVAKAITNTFKADRAKTIAALAKFGATKGPQLKPEQYGDFLKELAS